MYGIVSREGRLLWTKKFLGIGDAKKAVQANNFTYECCVAKVEDKRVVGEIYEFNADTRKWEVINND